VVEVNPRYTASVEVLEYATGLPALALHRSAFDPGTLLPPPAGPTAAVVGKAILFARRSLVFPEEGPWLSVLRSPPPVAQMPAFADIPAPGQRVEAGRPVLTFFARADGERSCLDALRRTAGELGALLFAGRGPE
jgi:predicted ATP-grasp superfamily ATP-dependent carboligase